MHAPRTELSLPVVRIQPSLPLLSAGLEDAAAVAGVRLETVTGATTIVSSPLDDTALEAPAIEFELGDSQVVIALTRPLGAAGWLALGRFIDQLVPLPTQTSDTNA